MTPKILQTVLQATQFGPRYSTDKSGVYSNYSEVLLHDSRHHERQSSTQSDGSSQCNPKRDWLVRHYQRVRRWAKIVSAASNVVSGLISAVIESIMIYVLYKFYSTSGIYIEDRPWGPWAKDSVVWPTFMFAAASIITSLIALAALIALCCRSKRKAASFSLIYVAVHIVTWVVVTIVYRVEKTEKDLWGWSCTDKAKAIQQQIGGQVDFEGLCKLQVS
jgi:magnesium-transporting ATPase (P-type)